MRPWNGWVHCTGSTYGTWLRGDPRGWRSRHHHEHCEGDYRSPPPKGMHDAKLARSRELMKRPGVYLPEDARHVGCAAMVEALEFHDAEPIAVCVGRVHWHALIRPIPQGRSPRAGAMRGDRSPRLVMGPAKRESARAMSRLGVVELGGVWARGCGRRWIKDRRHQVTVVHYIQKHAREGAATWTVIGGNLRVPIGHLIKPTS